jgi:hypothetical protein
MGSEFLTYLRLGVDHIADLSGYDHILFVAALSAVYTIAEWRRLVWLVTAFTVGHSITLALATLDLVRVDSGLVETLIPVTIVLAGIVNIIEWRSRGRWHDGRSERPPESLRRGKYALALAFGLIHGLGFSTFLRAILGDEEGIALPLLAFNIGLELGQLLIVAAVLVGATFMVRVVGLARRDWVMVMSGATAGIALTMIAGRIGG